MAERTAIAWTDHTFNTHVGCQEASPGCDHCYAREWANRYERWRGLWGRPALTPRRRTSAAYWRTPFAWDREAMRDGRRQRVFCNSLSDIFEAHPELDPIRRDLWQLIEQTPHLDWLLLTKRPEQIGRLLPVEWLEHPRENVWLGTSAETQRWADIRIPRLLSVPAVVHFVSAEPLLGPLHLERYLGPDRLNWVITGGESGPIRRPMDLDWVRSIRDQCACAGVAFFHSKVPIGTQGVTRSWTVESSTPGPDQEKRREQRSHAWPAHGCPRNSRLAARGAAAPDHRPGRRVVPGVSQHHGRVVVRTGVSGYPSPRWPFCPRTPRCSCTVARTACDRHESATCSAAPRPTETAG